MKIITLVSVLFWAVTIQANTIIHDEDFNNCGSISWTAVAGAGNSDSFGWECTTWSGRTYMNIYDSNGTGDEDWLISPAFNLDLYNQEYFSFEYDNSNAMNGLTLMYSTAYSGGTPNPSDWTPLVMDLYDIDNSMYVSQFLFQCSIDLSAISGTSVHLAFRYVSAGSGAQGWSIDNARVTADYYASIQTAISNGAKCYNLKLELHNHIKNHQYFEYTAGSFDLWDAFYVTDRRMNDAGTDIIVYDMYSDNPTGAEPYEFTLGMDQQSTSLPGSTAEGVKYNREHIFPQSWWGGSSVTPDSQRTDLHHVVPSDFKVNNMKSNYPMGETDAPIMTSMNGCKVGPLVSDNSITVFEPIDEYKGDFARMLLYFSTRYLNYMPSWASNYSDAMDGNGYTSFDPWLLNTLIAWHENDPVSQKEIDRNNAIYSLQKNRNPFIDHPEYVFFIWGSVEEPGCPTISLPVELADFRGEVRSHRESLLHWATASEEGSLSFVVEHSTDGIRFIDIGEVQAAGYSSEPNSYKFLHEGAASGQNYYRLRMMDLDGTEEWSKIIVLEHQRGGIFDLRPTLTDGEVWLSLGEDVQSANIGVFDMQGRRLLIRGLEIDGEDRLDLGHLPNGVYIVQCQSGSLVETKRVFVK